MSDAITKIIARLIVALFVDWMFMLAWNQTMPRLFGVPELSYWDALLLTFIVKWATTHMIQQVEISK